MAQEIHISINKSRLLIQIILLCLIGIFSLIGFFGLAENSGLNPLIFQFIGVVVCIFCIFTAAQKVKKRNDVQAGLLIGREGINDQSSDIGIGLIKWKDIIALDEEESRQAKLVVIKVRKQNDYIKNAKNSAVERLLKQNMSKFDTPVVIDTKYLEQSFNEILELLIQETRKRKK